MRTPVFPGGPIHGRKFPAAFSLVEVCLAIGIVAFALLPLVGLLSVGLDSYQSANRRGRAAQTVSQIISCIRLATAVTDANGQPTGAYTAAPPFQAAAAGGKAPISWSLGTVPSTQSFTIYFDENGEITTLTPSGIGWKSPMAVAVVVVTTPTKKFDPGTCQVAVAWPANGAPFYSGANGGITFANPQGHEENTIFFVPSAP